MHLEGWFVMLPVTLDPLCTMLCVHRCWASGASRPATTYQQRFLAQGPGQAMRSSRRRMPSVLLSMDRRCCGCRRTCSASGAFPACVMTQMTAIMVCTWQLLLLGAAVRRTAVTETACLHIARRRAEATAFSREHASCLARGRHNGVQNGVTLGHVRLFL